MSKPSIKITRTIRSEQVLKAFVAVVRPSTGSGSSIPKV